MNNDNCVPGFAGGFICPQKKMDTERQFGVVDFLVIVLGILFMAFFFQQLIKAL